MTEKIDVLALAREAGFWASNDCAIARRPSGQCTDELQKFAALVLERAAVECLDTDVVEDSGGMSYYAQLGDAAETRDAIAEAIRALKPNQEA